MADLGFTDFSYQPAPTVASDFGGVGGGYSSGGNDIFGGGGPVAYAPQDMAGLGLGPSYGGPQQAPYIPSDPGGLSPFSDATKDKTPSVVKSLLDNFTKQDEQKKEIKQTEPTQPGVTAPQKRMSPQHRAAQQIIDSKGEVLGRLGIFLDEFSSRLAGRKSYIDKTAEGLQEDEKIAMQKLSLGLNAFEVITKHAANITDDKKRDAFINKSAANLGPALGPDVANLFSSLQGTDFSAATKAGFVKYLEGEKNGLKGYTVVDIRNPTTPLGFVPTGVVRGEKEALHPVKVTNDDGTETMKFVNPRTGRIASELNLGKKEKAEDAKLDHNGNLKIPYAKEISDDAAKIFGGKVVDGKFVIDDTASRQAALDVSTRAQDLARLPEYKTPASAVQAGLKQHYNEKFTDQQKTLIKTQRAIVRKEGTLAARREAEGILRRNGIAPAFLDNGY